VPVIAKSSGADPSKILAIKSSTGDFYDKVKDTTRMLVFDDFSPEGKGTRRTL
jgi:hypothetical protein